MPVLEHIHIYVKYKRNMWKNPDLYKCADPDCTHFTDRGMIVGKRCTCPSCNSEFIMTREQLRRVRPVCEMCSNTTRGKRLRATRELVSSLFNPPIGPSSHD